MPATRCARCHVRDHALGGHTRSGAFMLALPIQGDNGRTSWPRIGTSGWCGTPEGEVERLTIIRVALTRTVGKALCQHCLVHHHAERGMFVDLFSLALAGQGAADHG